jgi:hypothetical protein
MLAIAERRARPKAERFDPPSRDGRVFLHHFPALRTGLLSLRPSGTSPLRTILTFKFDAAKLLQAQLLSKSTGSTAGYLAFFSTSQPNL